MPHLSFSIPNKQALSDVIPGTKEKKKCFQRLYLSCDLGHELFLIFQFFYASQFSRGEIFVIFTLKQHFLKISSRYQQISLSPFHTLWCKDECLSYCHQNLGSGNSQAHQMDPVDEPGERTGIGKLSEPNQQEIVTEVLRSLHPLRVGIYGREKNHTVFHLLHISHCEFLPLHSWQH